MMKAIYSFDNRTSAKVTHDVIKKELKDYKIYSASSNQEIDLDVLYYKTCDTYKKEINNRKFPKINYSKIIELINLIKNINPDLIISDNEFIVPYIGNILNIDVISISFLNILEKYQPKFGYSYYSKYIKNQKSLFNKFDFIKYKRKFVYSNLYKFALFDNLDIDWLSAFDNEQISNSNISAYVSRNILYKICEKVSSVDLLDLFKINKSNIYITTGENHIISNIIKNNSLSQINIIPSFDDVETLIMALIIRQLNLGLDLGNADCNLSLCLERIVNIVEQNKYFFTEFSLQTREVDIHKKRNIIVDHPEPLFELSSKKHKNLLEIIKENYE